MACIVDCIDTYGCRPIIESEPGAIFTPFVELNLGGQIITAGNSSAPPDNHATISSFEYGLTPGSTGYGATFEIIDQGGVMSRRIIQAINKTAAFASSETMRSSFDFGWIIKQCDGTVYRHTAQGLSGRKLHGMITKVEQSYEGGKSKLKFKIEAPPSGTIPDLRHDDTEGDESQKITLKTALTELFTQNHPKFSNVRFVNKDGGILKFKESDGDGDGPKAAWPINQQSSLAAARTWLNSVTTENERGILICYDPHDNSIVFQEDKTEKECCDMTIGTYIVNGGNCSTVLEFNPTLTWQPLGTIPGGGAGAGSNASGANDAYVEPTIDVQKTGTQTSPAIQQHDWMWRHPESLAVGASEGVAAQLEANRNVEVQPGFSAQLKLHGDPVYSDPMELIKRTVSIIVINPFHIDEQCTWITKPNCNPIMSNKKWNIKGVNHQITAGSYITTLEVYLVQPNKDIDANDKLGGGDCGTESFAPGDLGGSEAIDANG